MDTAHLPSSWLQPPYAWHTLLGIARDQGHEPTPSDGDDGQMQVRCLRCPATLWIDRGAVRLRTLLDVTCARRGLTVEQLTAQLSVRQ
jgi:hypothetical protein